MRDITAASVRANDPPFLDPKERRIVDARMRLKERFAQKRPSPSPGRGSGPPNRHGEARLPPGQHEAKGWPVLDLGRHPEIERRDWKLTVDGACDAPMELGWEDFTAFPVVEDVSDFHCVTTWSKFDMRWRGVRFLDVAAAASPVPSARFILCHGYDGYTTNLPLEEAIKPDVLIAFEVDGEPLPLEHGGPARMITPQLYAWKGAKWISRIEFLEEDQRGYWEERGYSNTALPWDEDRYSE